MGETRVCKCGFGRRAAATGYGRLLLGSALAVAAIAVAHRTFPGGYEIAATAALSVLLALTVASDVAALWANSRLAHCTGQPHRTATGPWPWLFLVTVFGAAPALFAAAWPVLAIVVEIYVVGRAVVEGNLAAARAGLYEDEEFTVLDRDVARSIAETIVRYSAVAMVTVLCATTWLVTGTAPAWAESTILATLWIGASALSISAAAMVWSDMVHDYLAPRDDDSGPSFLAEPHAEMDEIPVVSVGWAGWWLANAGSLMLVYQLSLARHTALAAVFVLLLLMIWAVNTERKLRVPEERRGEIGQPYLALHAAVRDIARALHLAIATPIRAARRVLGRKP